MKILEDVRVLVVEESSVRRDLFADWLFDVETKTASNQSEFHNEFDSSVVVVCLSDTALGEDADSIKKYILSQNPYCQLVGVLPRESFVTPYEDLYDEIIQRPVFKKTLQSTVESRLVAGAYSNLLRDLYRINSLLVSLRRAADEDVINKQQKITTIESRHDEIESNIAEFQAKLSQETLFDILQTIENHNTYLKTPEKDVSEGKSTKYRPRRCPSCKLPWGVNHRNDLGSGCTKLGANVYQCARCDAVVHGLAGEQQVY